MSAADSTDRSYISRLSFNSEGWQRPTGEAHEHEASETYNARHKFGHEDWFFRNEWQIEGWRYAFLQGVNKSRNRLLETPHAIDVTLFTIHPDRRRRYVATIHDLECLDDQQATEAFAEFKARGWFETMLADVRRIGGDEVYLRNSAPAHHVLNVRFRLENVSTYAPNHFATDDVLKDRFRYLLYRLPTTESAGDDSGSFRGRTGSELPPELHQITAHLRSAQVKRTPEHARMQAELMRLLREEFPNAKVLREDDFIDVMVQTDDQILLFEIKSDVEARSVIRHALGQILEYAFHPNRQHSLPLRLFIVGRYPLTPFDTKYLERLQTQFRLPVQYRVLPL
jgi:hypothetical protein